MSDADKVVAAAMGAVSGRLCFLRLVGVVLVRIGWEAMVGLILNQGADVIDFFMTAVVGEKPVMADTDKALRENMQAEAAQELVQGQFHDLGFAGIGVVFPSKTHAIVLDGEDAAVGNGGAVGVAGEVAQNLLRTREGAFGIDGPFFAGALA